MPARLTSPERPAPASAEPSGEQMRYTLSSMPPLLGDVTLLVGLEEQEDGLLRVYLGSRWKNLYMLIGEPEVQDHFRRAWASGAHVWMWPLPPADAILHAEPQEVTP